MWQVDYIISCNAHSCGLQVTSLFRSSAAGMMPMAFTALICNCMEHCQMVVCKFIAAVQYMHVLRELHRGFCTIVLHLY